MVKKNIKAIKRILILLMLVFIAVASLVTALPLFWIHLYLYKIDGIFLLDFVFICFVSFGIPAICIFLIRYLLKQYNVIK